MKIRSVLTLKYTFVTAAVLLCCLVLIYLVAEHARGKIFFHDMKSEAIVKAHLFIDEQVDPLTMQSIYLNDRNSVNEVGVAIYSADYNRLYEDTICQGIVKNKGRMIDSILAKKEIERYIGKYQCVGFTYLQGGNTYVIVAVAYDGYGYANLAELQKILFVLFFVGLSMLFVAGYILAGTSLQPIRNIVNEAETITASNIGRRIPVKYGKDELAELSLAFNALLDRLENSFNSQKMFISNVSHELRTPLAVIVAELDLCLQKQRTEEQYRSAIQRSLHDAWQMTDLIEGLLDLAKADYSKESIKMQEIRLDELLLDVRKAILRAHPEYHVELLFGQEEADDDRLITVKGNLYLLNIAFSNLVENNCKYSKNKTSFIQISFWEDKSIIRLSDAGIGLSETDKQNLFTLFYRGEQNKDIEGHGIGMALVHKIILLHQGNISVNSEEGKGTTFIVELFHV